MFIFENVQSLLGLGCVTAVCWAASENRSLFPWRLVLAAIALQAVLVFLMFGVPATQGVLTGATGAVDALGAATAKGTQFVFGYLGGGPQPYSINNEPALFVFAFQVLPLILVISALSALLWHWKILNWLIWGFGFLFQKTMGLGGASALGVASNIFLGMIETPIVIKAYLDRLSRSELFLLMVVGFSTVAGSTMVAYAALLRDVLPNAAGHVLAASILSAPAGVALAKIMVPEKPGEGGSVAEYDADLRFDSSLDAVVKGTADGLTVVLSISAVLLVFVSIVALGDMVLGAFPPLMGAPMSFDRIFSWVFAPVGWLMGVTAAEADDAGRLLGVKLMLTEFTAYIQLGAIPAGEISERTRMLLTYALCGFANVGSVGITVAGLGVLAPERRAEVMGMVWKAMAAGFLANVMSAAVVGALPPAVFG